MSLDDFLQALFQEGRILIGAAPAETPDGDAAATLERAYRTVALELAGPPPPFDGTIALAAARLTYHAAWYLLSHDEPEAELQKTLVMPCAPSRPEQHLSADLGLRYVPALHRRAHALAPDDALPRLLADLLRGWPLSGVLADIDEGPLTAPDFGHPGLWFFYTERLARHDKAAWHPTSAGREFVEVVWHELGKNMSLLPVS